MSQDNLCIGTVINIDLDQNQFHVDPNLENLTARNIHHVFNGTIQRSTEDSVEDDSNRITNYPLTLHVGPVMAKPSMTLFKKAISCLHKFCYVNFVSRQKFK